jgi:esterase
MKLFYRKFGEGPPLVILHGLYGSSDNWVTIAKSLGKSFTVYLPDQRNHGQSPHSEIHDYNSMRDDLFELITGLQLKKFFLAGHSMGGKTAISFACKWPEMLYGLLIADVSPFARENTMLVHYNEHHNILKAILSLDLSVISSRAEADAALSKMISPEKIRGLILKNLQRTDGDRFVWKLNARSLSNNLNRIMESNDINEAVQYTVTGFPVIFLKGMNSDYITGEDRKDILKIFPTAEFTEVENSGHWINADRPDEVIRNIKRLAEDY